MILDGFWIVFLSAEIDTPVYEFKFWCQTRSWKLRLIQILCTLPNLGTSSGPASKLCRDNHFWSLFASGFARFQVSGHPPDLHPDCAAMVTFGRFLHRVCTLPGSATASVQTAPRWSLLVVFCIGFCTLLSLGTPSGPASELHASKFHQLHIGFRNLKLRFRTCWSKTKTEAKPKQKPISFFCRIGDGENRPRWFLK